MTNPFEFYYEIIQNLFVNVWEDEDYKVSTLPNLSEMVEYLYKNKLTHFLGSGISSVCYTNYETVCTITKSCDGWKNVLYEHSDLPFVPIMNCVMDDFDYILYKMPYYKVFGTLRDMNDWQSTQYNLLLDILENYILGYIDEDDYQYLLKNYDITEEYLNSLLNTLQILNDDAPESIEDCVDMKPENVGFDENDNIVLLDICDCYI